MYDVLGDVGLAGDPDGDGDVGEMGWKVGLCDGACRGFLGRREMGGECSTSDYHE
jgi:hypothetical protein